jgi:organic radical activating enzyme
MKEGKLLPVMETFVSVQGEGYHVGTPSFFIRIGGCDVGCHWCDVKESWNPEIHPLTDVDEIVSTIPPTVKTAIITGGEPLLYNLNYLTKRLKEKNLNIHLETSGTGHLTGTFDWICLSPKKITEPFPGIYPHANELKIIIHNKKDFEFAEEQARKVPVNTRLYLQPEWSVREKILPFIIDFIIRNPGWKLSLQTHKYIGLP